MDDLDFLFGNPEPTPPQAAPTKAVDLLLAPPSTQQSASTVTQLSPAQAKGSLELAGYMVDRVQTNNWDQYIGEVKQYVETVSISSPTDQEQVELRLKELVRFKRGVEAAYEGGAKFFSAMHKLWTGARSAYLDPLEKAEKALKSKIDTYKKLIKQQREQELQAQRKQAAENAEMLKLGIPVNPSPVTVTAPPPTNMTAGVGERTTPWEAVIQDENAFYAALASNPELRQYAPPAQALLNSMARSMGIAISHAIPGVVAKRETITSVRL